MAELPSETIYNILSRLPVKSLARFRCVSKQWRNYINDSYLETMHAKRAAVKHDRMLIMLHRFPSGPPTSPCTLSFLEYKAEVGTLEVRKRPPVMEFMCKGRGFKDIVLGSCNGLLYSSQHHRAATTLVVIHPLRRECYELPPINTPFHLEPSWPRYGEWSRLSVEWSSGLGFDDSTNTFKMVCVVTRLPPHLHPEGPDVCTMVHVLGTNSWRKIPQVPSYLINKEGVFANGCLHWLTVGDYSHCPVIRFDMKTEEFGLIEPPKNRPASWFEVHLVDLHGEVGFVHISICCSVEVWVLKDRGCVMHCKFRLPPLSSDLIKVVGFWNENGDVLVTYYPKQMFVYNVESDSLQVVGFVGGEERPAIDMRMYQSSLFSTRYPLPKIQL